MSIEEMSAGREMDGVVAEKVMGWEHIGDVWCLDNKAYDAEDIPHYSTDIAAAMTVKERMRLDGFSFFLFESAQGTIRVSFICPFGPCTKHGNLANNHHGAYTVEADTVSLAICRASLIALKVNP